MISMVNRLNREIIEIEWNISIKAVNREDSWRVMDKIDRRGAVQFEWNIVKELYIKRIR